MLHLAGREEDWVAYRRLAPLVDGDTLDLIDRVALAEASADTAAIRAELAKIPDAEPVEALGAIADAGGWTRDFDSSDRLAQRAIQAGHSPEGARWGTWALRTSTSSVEGGVRRSASSRWSPPRGCSACISSATCPTSCSSCRHSAPH